VSFREIIMARTRTVAFCLAAAIAVSGCAGDRGYGYGEVGVAGPANPYFGWYGDYYYPGAGYYVYDRSGGEHRWNRDQHHYWGARAHGNPGQRGGAPHWEGYTGGHAPASFHGGGGHGGHHR
jgi:hypothetical protein